jgi:FAD/FMN-containing dehydrogenase
MRRPAPAPHADKVAALAAQVKALRGQTVHLDKGGVHHFVPLPGDARFRGPKLDLTAFREVLAIDPAARVATVEPGVTFAALVEKTLAHGLVPGVVPELTGITVGGAVAGCSVESMSYRVGGFHDTCLSYEVVTGEGEVVRLTPEGDPLAFGMIHGSYGTLGVLTRVTCRLYPAKPYVKLTYVTFPTVETFEAEVRERIAAADHDFVDGIIHGPGRFVVCLGQFVSEAPYLSSYRRLHIYYKSTAARAEDYLTTADYFFRYDTECHWLSRTVPPLEWKLVRWALGGVFLGSENLIRWSGRLAPLLGLKRRPDVVVDLFLPGKRFAEFYRWYEESVRYFPLWVVPYRMPSAYAWLSPAQVARMDGDLFFDCAIYGKPNGDPATDWSEELERKTFELGGIKTLISRNHYSPERFWDVYHRDNYERMKARFDPGGLWKGVYDKLVSARR